MAGRRRSSNPWQAAVQRQPPMRPLRTISDRLFRSAAILANAAAAAAAEYFCQKLTWCHKQRRSHSGVPSNEVHWY